MSVTDTEPDSVEQATALAVNDPLGPPSGRRHPSLTIVLALIGVAVVVGWSIVEPKIFSTALTVVVAVAVAGGIWIALNLLFDQVRSRWIRFQTIAYAVVGALFGIALHGNLVTLGSGQGFVRWIIGPVAGAAAFGVLGYLLAVTIDPPRRRPIALGGALAIGVATGLVIRERFQPELDPVAIAAFTVVVAGLGAGLSALRRRPPLDGALTGGALGWVLGAWGAADLGGGSLVTSLVACVVPAALIGVRLGRSTNPDYVRRMQIDDRSRALIFVGPALAFISVMLVIPTIRTIYLSLYDKRSVKFIGLDNYETVFTDRNSFDSSDWTNMFTSFPFVLGVVLLGIALVTGIVMKARTGRAVELGNPTGAPLAVGFLLVCFGVFTALRGTLINNLWWVVTVTFLSTALGLAVAVLADNRFGERAAKSLIFMPMAISLVGASIIWRFVYAARDTNKPQTGVLNALWVGLGRLSTGSGLPTLLATVALGLALVLALVFVARALARRRWGGAVTFGVIAFLIGWAFVRFTGVVGDGLGGFVLNAEGESVPKTVLFVQESPYNNFWLMVILIWIQVGFAMVILSAAIKAVPTELLEAARMDGATTSQVFWRVTLPQIATTVGVVVTTLIVLVMKVYDIVKVVTNGQFGTQVLANNMFEQAFRFSDTGLGAALAIVIFVSVLPVMYYNIRRAQREG